MIHQIFLDLSPIKPGEKRPLRVDSGADVTIDFYCYREPPGRFVVCGQIILRPGKTTHIGPDEMHFPPGASGIWRLVVRDREDGDVLTVEIAVASESAEGNSGTQKITSA